MFQKKIFFILFLFYSNSVISQHIVSGQVFDKNNNESLIGANVVVYSNSEVISGSTSDFDGKFSINLPSGEYTFELSYIGYNNIELDTIVDGSLFLGEFFLIESSTFLSDVVISSKQVKNTETAIINLKNKSINSIDAVSSQSINKSGDSNVASAIKRVSGVSVQDGKYVFVRGLGDRYSKTVLNGLDIPTLDPDKNTVQMDIFPTAVIDRIVVFKSFTSNLPADFSGGLVDISTKSIPEEKVVKFSLSTDFSQASFNKSFLTYHGGKFDFLGFDDGTRSLPFSDPLSINNIPFGINIYSPGDPNYETIMDFTRSFKTDMRVQRSIGLPNISFSFFGSNNINLDSERKLGFYSGLTFKNNNTYYEGVRQNFLEKNANSSIYQLDTTTYQYGDIGQNTVLLSLVGGVAYDTEKSNYKLNLLAIKNTIQKAGYFYQENRESNANYLKKENIDYSEKSIFNLFLEAKHTINNALKLNWSVSPTYSIIRDKDIRETAYEMINIENVSLDEIQNYQTDYMIDASNAGVPSRMWRDLDELNIISKLDFDYKHNIGVYNSTFKFGVYSSFKQRDYQILRYTLKPINLGTSDFTGNPNEILTDLLYSDPDGQAFTGDESGFYVSGDYQPSNTYNGLQVNLAGYLLEEIDFSSLLKTIVGLRIENYQQYYTGQSQTSNVISGDGIFNNDNVLSDFGIFPSLTVIYKLNEKTNLRGSYSLTTARPSFKEKSGAQILDVLSGITFNGNLDLKVTDITNYDIRLDHFFNNNQMIGISGFYKDMNNPIEISRYASDDDNIQPINTSSGKVYGLEFEARKELNFITQGLFTTMNTSLIFSEVDISGDEYDSVMSNLRDEEGFSNTRAMQGQAPFILNLSLSYAIDKFDIALFYNVEGEKLSVVGVNRRPNIYVSPFHSMNFKFSKIILENLKISFMVKNLLNQDKEMFAKSFGIDDQLYSSFSPGRIFSFKMSYNL